jgi:hypothetical protein
MIGNQGVQGLRRESQLQSSLVFTNRLQPDAWFSHSRNFDGLHRIRLSRQQGALRAPLVDRGIAINRQPP